MSTVSNHGTRGVYANDGCRCDDCVQANAEYGRDYMKRFRMKRIGITEEEYQKAWDKQGGLCPICEGPFDGVLPDMDHNHRTGKFRGLLCRRCNLGLGQLGDSIATLGRAVNYLAENDGDSI